MNPKNNLSPQDAIKIAGEAQRLSYLKSIPGNWFGLFTSLFLGAGYSCLVYEYIPGIVVSIMLFFGTIYIQKRRTGLWPFGSAPLMLHGASIATNKSFWKTMKLNLAIQFMAAIVTILLFAFFVDILELKDMGYWWLPLVAGAIVGIMMFLIFVNSNNYYRKKYSENFDG